MPGGRPRVYATEEERRVVRREQVRRNVRAFRERQAHFHGRTKSPIGISGQTISQEKAPFHSSGPEPEEHEAEPGTVWAQGGLPASVSIGAVDSVRAFQYQSMQLLLHHYLPSSRRQCAASVCLPGSELASRASTWLLPAYQLADDREGVMLHQAILALALATQARIHKDQALAFEALIAYQKILRNVRSRIMDIHSPQYTPRHRQLMLPICIVLAYTELICNSSWESFHCHLNGISAIFVESRTTRWSCLQSDIVGNFYHEWRVMHITQCFLSRQPPFYASHIWHNLVDIKKQRPSLIPLSELIDIACHIPGIMHETDTMSLSDLGTSDALCSDLEDIHAKMRAWRDDLVMLSPGPLYDASLDGPLPNYSHFADYNFAYALVLYHAFSIYCIQTLVKLRLSLHSPGHGFLTPISPLYSEVVDHSTAICRSMSYFFHADSGIAGRHDSRFPFETACQGLHWASNAGVPDLEARIKWCKKTLTRYCKPLPVHIKEG